MSAPGEAEFTAHRTPHAGHEECYACPVGALFAEARELEPAALDHLMNAALELVQVAKSVLEAAEHAIEAQRSARSGPRPRVRRIDLDA
jgi:hypothetical protein